MNKKSTPRRRQSIRTRFSRLSPWNKLGVIAACIGIASWLASPWNRAVPQQPVNAASSMSASGQGDDTHNQVVQINNPRQSVQISQTISTIEARPEFARLLDRAMALVRDQHGDEAIDALRMAQPKTDQERMKLHAVMGSAYMELGNYREARQHFRHELTLRSSNKELKAEWLSNLLLTFANDVRDLVSVPAKGGHPFFEKIERAKLLVDEFKNDVLNRTFETPDTLGFDGVTDIGVPPTGWHVFTIRGTPTFGTSHLSNGGLQLTLITNQSAIALWRPVSINLDQDDELSWAWKVNAQADRQTMADGLYPCQVVVVIADGETKAGVAIHYTWSLTHDVSQSIWYEPGEHEVVGIKAAYLVVAGKTNRINQNNEDGWQLNRRTLMEDYSRACVAVGVTSAPDPRVVLIGVQSLSQHDDTALSGSFRSMRLHR